MGAAAYSSPCADARAVRLAGDLAMRLANKATAVLARAGIIPMPLKGVLLLAKWPQLIGMRDLADVDFLVPKSRFADAEQALRAIGFEATSRTSRGATLVSNGWPLSLDLHHRLFAPHLFGMATDFVLRRATIDRTLFDLPTMRMADADHFAHIVGHVAKDRTPLKHENLEDVRWLLHHNAPPAKTLADQLHTLRLHRAAGYVLGADALRDEPHAIAVRSALRLRDSDLRAIERVRANPTAAWAPHLLNGSVIEGLRSFRAQASEVARRRFHRPRLWTARA